MNQNLNLGKKVKIRRQAACSKFVFIKPKPCKDADEFAKFLVMQHNVQEVYVGEGDYGYIIKAKLDDDRIEGELIKVSNNRKQTGKQGPRFSSYFKYTKTDA